MGTNPNVNVDSLLNQILNIVSPATTEEQMRDALQSMRGGTKNVPAASTGFQNPIKGTYYCTGAFGQGDARHKGIHNGADLRASGGTPVYPITDGTVISVTGGGKGGNVVVIQHSNKLTSRYAHLGIVNVHPGDNVNKNTIIATVGDSGNAAGTAPHIHLEIKENGQFVNPNKYIYVPPYSDLQPEEKGRLWLSEEAKKEARSFKMNEHLANKNRSALASRINKLEKIANLYDKIAKSFDY